MSRYKKIITGETELPEISGNKFIIFPTIETRMELLEHIKSTQIIEEVDEKDDKGRVLRTKKIRGKYFELPAIAKTCAKLVYEGLWEHDSNGERTKIKEGEEDMSFNDILSIVLNSDIMNIYLECASALDIISKEKTKEIKASQKNAIKN